MVLPIETPICGPRWLLNVTLSNVCFEAYYGLKSDIAPRPKSADTVAKFESCIGPNFW
jgi:hypothetical protein